MIRSYHKAWLKSKGEPLLKVSFLHRSTRTVSFFLLMLCLVCCLELLYPFFYRPKDEGNTEKDWVKNMAKKHLRNSFYFWTFIMRVDKLCLSVCIILYCLYQFELKLAAGCNPKISYPIHLYSFIPFSLCSKEMGFHPNKK